MRAENLPAESKLQRELHEVTIHNLAHPDSKLKPSLKEHGCAACSCQALRALSNAPAEACRLCSFVVAPFKVPKGIDWNDEESVGARSC